jgi:hypothetical protein
MHSNGLQSRTFQLANLTAVQAALAGEKVRLLKGLVAESRDTTIAELVANIATFGGYADSVVAAWTPIAYDADGVPYISSGVLTFTCTGAPFDNVITGLWGEHGMAPTVPDFLGSLSQPVPLNIATTAVSVLVKIRGDGSVHIMLLPD